MEKLKADPALKIACGRCSDTGADLMSQPSLSRLEHRQRDLEPDQRLIRVGRECVAGHRSRTKSCNRT
jgi:hypothetical protein